MVALEVTSMRGVTLALLALLLCVLSAEASHFRYSTISWTPIGPSSVRFKLDFAYRRDYEWGRWFGEQYTNVPNDNNWLGGSNQGNNGAYQKFTENNNQYKDYKLRFPVGAQTNNIKLSDRGGGICSHWMDTGKIKETPVCTTGQTVTACEGREVSLKADAAGDLVIDTTLSKYTPDNCCRDASVAVTDSDFYCSPYNETHGFFLGDGATSTIDVQIAYVTQEMTDLGNHLYGTATVQHTYATPQKADGTPWVAFFQGGNRLTYLNHNKRGRFRIETSVDIQWDSANNVPLNRSPKATTMPVVPVPYTSRGSKFAKFQIAVIDPDTRQSGTGLPQNEEVRFELADLQGYGGMLASCMSDGERSCINSQSFPGFTYTKEDYTNRRQAIINKHCGGTCGGCPKKCMDMFKSLSGGRDGDDSEYDRCFDCEKYPEWKDETHLAHPPKDLFIDPKRGEVVWETGTAEFEVDGSAYVEKESLGEMFLTGASPTYYSANVYCDGVSTKPWTAAESLEGKNMNGCITKDVSKESKLSGFYNLALKIYSPKKPGLALGTYANEIFVPLDFLMYLYAPMHYCGLTCQNNQRGPSTFTSIDGYYGYDSITPAETLSVTGISKPSGLGTGKCTICGGGERADNGTDNRKDASYCKPKNDDSSACPSVSTPAFSASNPRDVGYISKGLCPGVKISGAGLEISPWVNNKESPRTGQYWYGRDESYGQYFGGCDQPRVAQTNEVGSVRPTAGACYLNNAPYFIVGNNPNDQSDNLTPRPHPFESWDYAPTARVARKKGSTITFNLVATDDDSCVELGIRSSGMLSLEGMEDLSNPVYTSYKVNRQGAEVTRSFRWPARITSTANANAATICTAGSATQRVVEGTTLYLCDSLLVPEEDIRPEDTLICFYPFDSYIVGAFLCVHIKLLDERPLYWRDERDFTDAAERAQFQIMGYDGMAKDDTVFHIAVGETFVLPLPSRYTSQGDQITTYVSQGYLPDGAELKATPNGGIPGVTKSGFPAVTTSDPSTAFMEWTPKRGDECTYRMCFISEAVQAEDRFSQLIGTAPLLDERCFMIHVEDAYATFSKGSPSGSLKASDVLPLLTTDCGLTMGLWFQAESMALGDMPLLSAGYSLNGDATEQFVHRLHWRMTATGFGQLVYQDDNAGISIVTDMVPDQHEWHYATLTIDTAGKVTLYLDGTERKTTLSATGKDDMFGYHAYDVETAQMQMVDGKVSTVGTIIGSKPGSTPHFYIGSTQTLEFSGSMSEVRVYSRAITAAEVKAKMFVELTAADEVALVGYYNMRDFKNFGTKNYKQTPVPSLYAGSTQTEGRLTVADEVKDRSGRGHHAKLFGTGSVDINFGATPVTATCPHKLDNNVVGVTTRFPSSSCVTVHGNNFAKSQWLTCDFGGAKATATWMSEDKVECCPPENFPQSMPALEVSNNNIVFSDQRLPVRFMDVALHNDGVNDFIAADGVLDDLNTTQLGYSINLWFYPEDNYPCSTPATNVGRRQVCPTTSGIIWSFKSKVVNAIVPPSPPPPPPPPPPSPPPTTEPATTTLPPSPPPRATNAGRRDGEGRRLLQTPSDLLTLQGIVLVITPENYLRYFEVHPGDVVRGFTSNTTISRHNWHHIGFSVTPQDADKNQSATLYIDGKPDITFQPMLMPEDVYQANFHILGTTPFRSAASRGSARPDSRSPVTTCGAGRWWTT